VARIGLVKQILMAYFYDVASLSGKGQRVSPLNSADRDLVRALTERAAQSYSDWSYSGDAGRAAAHGLIRYPAMMVPSMQRDILQAVKSISPKSKVVLDPFVGSGTALTESLAAGYSFVGYDINPLAVLISRVKAKPHHARLYEEAAEHVVTALSRDRRLDYAVRFSNQEKWFRRSNSIGLSRIRRAIERLSDINCRRFMWVTLAETIRRCSNSRTSTYKLHVRDDDEIGRLDGMAVPIFKAVLKQNVERISAEKARLKSLGLLVGKTMHNTAVVSLADICKIERGPHPDIDIVLTSPPYGDNRTTVPYGQFSYLALRWIPHEDIDPGTNAKLLETTHSLDTASLGGGNRTDRDLIDELESESPSYSRLYRRLKSIDGDAAKRWTAYCRDLSQSVRKITKSVRSGGHLVWTVGQRRIRSNNAPLVRVLSELHQQNRAAAIIDLRRKIPSKRMPTHNSIGSLMQIEHICFYRKL
jgi:hypothetical protein